MELRGEHALGGCARTGAARARTEAVGRVVTPVTVPSIAPPFGFSKGARSGSSFSRLVRRLELFLSTGGSWPMAWCMFFHFWRRFWNQTCTQRGEMLRRCASSATSACRGRGSVSKTCSSTEICRHEKFCLLRRFLAWGSSSPTVAASASCATARSTPASSPARSIGELLWTCISRLPREFQVLLSSGRALSEWQSASDNLTFD